jgi:rhodanese-related sulfurtransferase
MKPEELKRVMETGRTPHIVDVRDREKFEAAHLPGARHIPLAELANHLEELRAAGPVLVYCTTGGKCSQALAYLKEQGFADAEMLEGGLSAWEGPVSESAD